MSTIITFVLLEVGKQALQSSVLQGKTKSLLLPCLLKNPTFLLAFPQVWNEYPKEIYSVLLCVLLPLAAKEEMHEQCIL